MLVGVPLPYIGIGKKIKKGWKLTYGIISFAKEKIFVNDDTVEHFTWFIEEFENYVQSNSTLSFLYMYWEVRNKTKLSKLESEHISDETKNIQERYNRIRDAEKLNRKKNFRENVKEFQKLVKDLAKMVKRMLEIINEKKLRSSELSVDFLFYYNFSATQFNHYLASFRNFLDRTYCFHSIEIEPYRLMQLLIPEEIELPEEKIERL